MSSNLNKKPTGQSELQHESKAVPPVFTATVRKVDSDTTSTPKPDTPPRKDFPLAKSGRKQHLEVLQVQDLSPLQSPLNRMVNMHDIALPVILMDAWEDT
eukprot:scaffold17388_cov16-Prasinocladus_malaysianus.AAC.1